MARMYYLQVIEADKYEMAARDNRISMRLLAPRLKSVLNWADWLIQHSRGGEGL